MTPPRERFSRPGELRDYIMGHWKSLSPEIALRRGKFKVGDHVHWNSEAGRVSGRIIKVHTRDTEYKGHPRHASRDEPQYEIKSDRTDHIAMHKGSALHKLG